MNFRTEGEFTFAGKNSADFGIYLSDVPSWTKPKRQQEVISVPGRNGDIIIPYDAWDNSTGKFSIFTVGTMDDADAKASAIEDWLSAAGYQRLENNFEPDVYRLAYYSGGDDISNILTKVNKGNLTFDAQPQRFLKVGERAITLTSGAKLRNPTSFAAKPQITVKGTGKASLQVGDYVISISNIGGEITIDSATQYVYSDGGKTGRGSDVSLTEYPELTGTVSVTWSGSGVTGVSIIPNWWKL